jgi:hypothetical protein
MLRKIPNVPRNSREFLSVSWQCWGNLGALQTASSGSLSYVSLTVNLFIGAGFSECVKLFYGPSVGEAFGNTVLMHGRFNDAVINTECVAQTFGCNFYCITIR